MTCYIIDDEQHAINIVATYIKEISYLNLLGSSTNPIKGLEFIHSNKVDLLFLDIQMDVLNGVELMKKLPSHTKVIFCTAYSEFAVSGFELEAIDYLVKPIEFLRFEKGVKRAYNAFSGLGSNLPLDVIPNDYIIVKTEQKGKYIRIDIDEIDYIESKRNYVEFNLVNGKVLVYSSLHGILDKLSSGLFMRVHKSYVVSLPKIRSIENGILWLKGKDKFVPISNSYREDFFIRFSCKIL